MNGSEADETYPGQGGRKRDANVDNFLIQLSGQEKVVESSRELQFVLGDDIWRQLGIGLKTTALNFCGYTW